MARKKTTKAVQTDTTDLAQPQNRTEEFLAKIAGLVDTLPDGEFSRLERYLKYIAENGSSSGVTSFNSRTGAVVPQSADYASFYLPKQYQYISGGHGAADEAAWNALIEAVFATMADNTVKWIAIAPMESWGLGAYNYYGFLARETENLGCFYGFNEYNPENPCASYIRKIKWVGSWKDVEISNPPLVEGKEYRTTERFLGKPVYQYLYDKGYVAQSSSPTDIDLPVSVSNNLADGVEARIFYTDSRGKLYTVSELPFNFPDYSDATVIKIGAHSYDIGDLYILFKYTKTS